MKKTSIKKLKKTINLKEKIYLLTFAKPRYKTEISKLIYDGKEVKQIYPEVNKLENDKWIKKIVYDYEPDKESGKRAKRRKYYKGRVEPLLNSICDEFKKIALETKVKTLLITPKEKRKLKSFLDDESFRSFVNLTIDWIDLYNETENPFSFVKDNIGKHCLYLHTVNAHFQHIPNSKNSYTEVASKIFDKVLNKYLKPWGGKNSKEVKLNNLEKYENLIINAKFFELGEFLIKKLANLTNNPNLLGAYFDSLIITGTKITNQLNKFDKKIKGNSHGSS